MPQHIRAKIGAVRPHNCADIGAHAHLIEISLISQGCEDTIERRKQRCQIHFARPTVVKPQKNTIAIERADLDDVIQHVITRLISDIRGV